MTETNNHPHSLQSEVRILSHMLFSDAASIVAEGVTAEWFYSKENQVMFESIRQVFDSGEDVDEISTLPVFQANMDNERMDSDMAAAILMSLPVDYSSSWMAALKNVRNKHLQRKMIHATREMLESLQKPLASADDIKAAIQVPMSHISTLTLADDDKTAREEIEEFISEKMKELSGEVDKIPEAYRVYTGMKNLEEQFGYIDRRRKDNNIIIVASLPSSARSLFTIYSSTLTGSLLASYWSQARRTGGTIQPAPMRR